MKTIFSTNTIIVNRYADVLDNTIEDIDFIFHFAGEVRPQSSDEEMHKSNAILTKQITDAIYKFDRKLFDCDSSRSNCVRSK